MQSNFYGCFRHETWGSEDCSKLLNFERKQRRMDIAHYMLTMFNDDPTFLKNVITCDESGVYGYNIKIEEIKRKIETGARSYKQLLIWLLVII